MQELVNILVIASTKEEAEDLNSLIPDLDLEKNIKIEKDVCLSLKEASSNIESGRYHLLVASDRVADADPLEFLSQVLKNSEIIPEIFILYGINSDLEAGLLKKGAWKCFNRNALNINIFLPEIFNAYQAYRISFEKKLLKQVYMKQMESMVRSMPEGVMMFDRFGSIVVINPAAKRYLKLFDQEGSNRIFTKAEDLEYIIDFLCAGEDCTIKEVEVIGRNIFLRFEATTVKDASGEIIGSVLLIRDITEEKKVDRIKNDFISIVSHELRTPLTTMKEFTSILLDEIPGKINSKQKEYLGIVKSNMDRLGRIINEILDISKMESGKTQIEREFIDMVEIARMGVKTFNPLASDKGLVLKISVPNKHLITYGDKDRLAEVFSNLVHNAIKFTSKGNVTVSLKETDSEIISQVEDTGIGIVPENMSKLFMKFQQFERDSNMQEPGTGLGLAISKHLVELHKGEIWAESEYEKGTKFIFTIPKYTQKQALLETVAENLHRCVMLNKDFSLIWIQVLNMKEVIKSLASKNISAVEYKKELGRLFKNVLRRNEDVIFYGQDDFVILLNMTSKDNAQAVKMRIEEALNEYYMKVDKPRKSLRVKIGLAGYPQDGVKEDELLEKAKNLSKNFIPKRRKRK